jgi:hypothetical protein
MSDAWIKLHDGTLAAGSAAWDVANVETLRLAVTGLSGAGKTVFLVSVISNLLAMGRGVGGQRWDSLPKLRKALANEQGHSHSHLWARPRFSLRTAALPDTDFDAAALLHIAALAAVGQLAIDVDHLSGRKRKDREFLESLVLVQDLHHGQGTGEAQTGIVRSVQARSRFALRDDVDR